MWTGGISTLNMSTLLRQAMASTQSQLAQAQTELASGQHADMGLALGAETGRDLLWHSELGGMQQMLDANKLAAVRAGLTQSSLSAIGDAANAFLSTLVGARNAQNGQELAKTAATQGLDQLTSLLNTAHDGQYIFGGTNSQQKPAADYAGSAGQSAVAAAFQSAFGMAPSDAAVNGISASAMQIFLDGDFGTLFGPAQWKANWSAASDRPMLSRVDHGLQVQASSTANGEAFRKLTEAFTMVASLGEANLNQAAFETVVDKALAVTGQALLGIGNEQSRLGLAQNQLSAANDRITLRLTAVTGDVQSVESVDKYEAATRANALMTQLETSYTLTGRISQLSLLKYL